MNIKRIRVKVLLASSLVALAAINETPTARGEQHAIDPVVGSIADIHAERIGSVAEPRETGFAHLRLTDSNRLDLWWKGEVDSDVRELVVAAEEDGVTVEIHPAQRSQAEMFKIIDKLFGNPAMERRAIGITTAAANREKSGLFISYKSKDKKKSKDEAKSDAKKVAEEETGVPVLSVEEDELFELDGVRQDDSSPWYGGSTIVSTLLAEGGRSRCSTGFSVTLTGEDVARPDIDAAKMLTALHCTEDPNAPLGFYDGTYNPSTGSSTWQVFARSVSPVESVPLLDSVLLDPEGDTAGRVYLGPWNAFPQPPYLYGPSITILGTHMNYEGQYVTVSGSNSGEHHGRISLLTGVKFACGLGESACGPGVMVDSVDADNIIAAEGDSGGPVFETTVAEVSTYAKGIVAHGSGARVVPCGGLRFSGLKCSSRVFYAPVWRIIDGYNERFRSLGLKLQMEIETEQ